MNILLDVAARPVVAHRGGSLAAPENTIEAMELAVSRGADALELDVRLSADGEVVVIHDPRVDRTTDGRGEVARMTLAQLRELDAGARESTPASWIPSLRRPCRIPMFDEILTRFTEIPLIIELKVALASAQTRSLIEKHDAQSRCFVASFAPEAMYAFRGSKIAVGATRPQAMKLLAGAITGLSFVPDFDALFISLRYRGFRLPMRRILAATRRAGKPTHVWTINDGERARKLWLMGASGIVTDDVPGALAARRALPG
jgi:glycerophosphoryl diester phosphodiesterase